MGRGLQKVSSALPVTPNMVKFAKEYVVTGNVGKAAEQCGLSKSYCIDMIRTNDEVKALIKSFTEAMLDELKTKIIAVCDEAITVERDIMLDKLVDPKERLRAAQDLLDRGGLVQKQQQSAGTINTINYFNNMTEHELDAILEVTAEEVDYEPRPAEQDSPSEDGETAESRV